MESPAQFGRMRTLIHLGPIPRGHVTVNTKLLSSWIPTAPPTHLSQTLGDKHTPAFALAADYASLEAFKCSRRYAYPPMAADKIIQMHQPSHMESTNIEFIARLREELLQIKEQSFERTKQKTLFVISLLGLGSLSTADSFILHFYSLLYLVPIVCFCYDVLYIGDKFAARRIGSFLRQYGNDRMSKSWETFVAGMRGPAWLYWFGEVGITVATILSSMIILYHRLSEKNAEPIEYIIPFVLNATLLFILSCLNWRAKKMFKHLDNISRIEGHHHKIIIGILDQQDA